MWHTLNTYVFCIIYKQAEPIAFHRKWIKRLPKLPWHLTALWLLQLRINTLFHQHALISLRSGFQISPQF
ncbi:hypothetical protein CW304_12510 [Bacillus sp. UFRGS-B20]|nr:hypothetical protein CW304_12510 [Bacillus sp. UFRGS-B20]